jgi:hypothetical protein
MAPDSVRTGETITTTEHETVRDWVEQRGSVPAQVTDPAGEDPGSLAIVPAGKDDDSLALISWEEFFEIFDDEGLAFVYQTEKENPREQWFCAFTQRDRFSNNESETTEASGRKTLAKLEGRRT